MLHALLTRLAAPHGIRRAALGAGVLGRRIGLAPLVLVTCAAAFYLHCLEYEVVQDDAYISFVYSKNLALGNGLVFNLGERVEGYTNFLWTLIHAVPHLIGADVVATAQVLGFVSALGLFAATWLLSRQLRPHRPALLHTPALVLLAANGALAFWTLSGMETLLFALLVTLGARSYVRELHTRRPHWRTGLLFGRGTPGRRGDLKGSRGDLRAHLPSLAPFLALVAPHFVFRLAYYGRPLPNTFYAKTGLGPEYLADGINYTWKFLVDYGFWGLGLAAPVILMLWRRQRAVHTYLGMVIGANALYVTAAGGDTMAENRLFLPVLALVYVELQELGYRLAHLALHFLKRLAAGQKVAGPKVAWLPVAAALTLLGPATHYTFVHARPQVLHARLATEAHNGKLYDLVDYIGTFPDPGALLVSSTAIGIPRYFTEAAVLDLVGLTDEVIAHNPQPLPGIRTNHRLRNYNVQYVMDRAPNLIYFITGEKPVTPAEKALFMSRQFRRGYYMTYITDERPVFARRSPGPLPPEDVYPSGSFVELYSRGLAASPHDSAQALFRACITQAPQDFAYAHAWLGRELYDHAMIADATPLFEQAAAIDSHCVMAMAHLAVLREASGRAEEAVSLAQGAVELAPLSHFCRYAHGRALTTAGRPVEGTAALLEALRLDGTAPSSTDAGFRLGLANYTKGDLRRARLAWGAVLRADPGHEGALTGLQLLEEQGACR